VIYREKNVSIRLRLITLQKALKLTQAQMAEAGGRSQSVYAEYIRGKNPREPGSGFVDELCRQTGVDANWLLGIVGDNDHPVFREGYVFPADVEEMIQILEEENLTSPAALRDHFEGLAQLRKSFSFLEASKEELKKSLKKGGMKDEE